ncbi:hypothetical protein LJR044_003171 [Microbacterium foliorum]
MTTHTSIAEATDNRTLLDVGVGSTAATPPPTSRDEGWEEHAAAFLASHPEISAAVPRWAEEVGFSEIDSEVEGTIFSFSHSIGNVELYGVGQLHNGLLQIFEGGRPSVYLPSEIDSQKVSDVAQTMLDLARDLISAAGLLRAEPKVLRRPVEVDDELQRLDI